MELRLSELCQRYQRSLRHSLSAVLPLVALSTYRTQADSWCLRPALLRRLLEGARALIFFSLYEGFGMPLLEAFDAGTPVLCSNTTSLPEVAQGSEDGGLGVVAKDLL